MTLTRLVVTLPYTTGLPEDVAQNVWYADGSLSSTLMLGEFGPRIVDFYNELNAYLSPYISDLDCTITAYDMTDPSPRAPVGVLPFSIATSGTSSLPLEVALCLSYRAQHVSGVAPARERGRLYLGPWNSGALRSDVPSSRPLQELIDDIAIAAAALLAENTSEATWVIYSPTQGGGLPITNGWVDNAWDTQRRRGSEPTSRQPFAIIP